MFVARIIRRLREQRGQTIIFFVGAFTVIAIVGAIVIDFGVWFSERRGAQTDSDLIALAGVYELLTSGSAFADVDIATQQSAVANGVDPVEDLQNLAVRSLEFPDGYETDPDYCHTATDTGGRLNAVVLDVDHDSRAFFAGIFGIGSPDIGAHACARAGSLRDTSGLRPWSVPRFTSDCFEWNEEAGEYIPQFGEVCIFRIDNPSQVGAIRLGPDEGDECSGPGSGGANVYRENIREGSPAICEIGEMIDTEPGLEPNPTKQALADMLATEGVCDALNSASPDTIDDFDESFVPISDIILGPTATFVAANCETPRVLSIVIVDEFDGTGFDSVPIVGFAAFFLVACDVLDNDGNVIEISRECDFAGVNFQIRGFFMSILLLEGNIGAFDEFGTKVIRLAE
ncbi:MAG: hypothetical protein IIC88_02530 [Chloroflexi bacterium]|nr:hypothetical protein [Chloroflexota bacterium]